MLFSSITDASPFFFISWMDLIIKLYWVIIIMFGPQKAAK